MGTIFQGGVIIMLSTYRLNADELTSDLISAIKKTYSHKNIEIVIQDVEDETEYLMRNPANKKHLLEAIKNVENKENLINLDSTEL
jgi:antitoxin YefM